MNRLYQRILLLLSVVMTGVSGMWAASPDKITLNTSSASGMTATYVKMTNTYVISTRSTSPYILSSALTSDLGGDNMVLAFQYKSTSGLSERPRFYLGTTYTSETSVLGPSRARPNGPTTPSTSPTCAPSSCGAAPVTSCASTSESIRCAASRYATWSSGRAPSPRRTPPASRTRPDACCASTRTAR